MRIRVDSVAYKAGLEMGDILSSANGCRGSRLGENTREASRERLSFKNFSVAQSYGSAADPFRAAADCLLKLSSE